MDKPFFNQVRAFMQRGEDAGVPLVRCARCGVLCRVAAEQPSAQARIARYATVAGMCLACTVTDWLKDGPLAELVTEEKLRDPRVQRRMAELYDSAPGHNDGSSSEIDWEALLSNWDLPSPKAKRRGRNV